MVESSGQIPDRFRLAIPKAKQRAGFICAPAYPGIAPLLAKDVNPTETPTSNGPRRGPNKMAWRGSKPTPYARNNRANDRVVSLRKTWPDDISEGSKKHPPPW